jgi:hypothetical protein
MSHGRLPDRAVAERGDPRSVSALIGVGRKEAERAARRPTGLERAVTWGCRGASGDGEERGGSFARTRSTCGWPRTRGPARGVSSAIKAHLDDALVERIREATNGNYALGDRRFQAEIEQALGRHVTKIKAGRPKAQGRRPE